MGEVRAAVCPGPHDAGATRPFGERRFQPCAPTRNEPRARRPRFRRALEARIAAARGEPSAVTLKAMRIVAEGRGRRPSPSPARRHWMDQSPYAYRCLP